MFTVVSEQTLSDYRTRSAGPEFLAANLRLADLITPSTGTQCRQPKPSLFGFSTEKGFGSRESLDATLIVPAVYSQTRLKYKTFLLSLSTSFIVTIYQAHLTAAPRATDFRILPRKFFFFLDLYFIFADIRLLVKS